MLTESSDRVSSQQRRRKTEQEGEVACYPLAGSPLDGPVSEDQHEREHQERGELQGDHVRPEQQEEACGEPAHHQSS